MGLKNPRGHSWGILFLLVSICKQTRIWVYSKERCHESSALGFKSHPFGSVLGGLMRQIRRTANDQAQGAGWGLVKTHLQSTVAHGTPGIVPLSLRICCNMIVFLILLPCVAPKRIMRLFCCNRIFLDAYHSPSLQEPTWKGILECILRHAAAFWSCNDLHITFVSHR